MRKNLRGCIALILVIFACCTQETSAQDAHFSQYYASSLYLNPAMAGATPHLTFSSNYRTQWRSIIMPYVTSQFSAIQPIYKKDEVDDNHIGGIGISFYNDRAGDGNFKTIGVNINAAYNLHLSRMQDLIFGVQGGFIQKNVDFTNLEWGEQFNPYVGFDATIDPGEPGLTNRVLYPDVSAGFLYYYNSGRNYTEKGLSAYLGFSAYHINRPNESMVRDFVNTLPILFKGHAGFEMRLGEKVNISPNALFMMQNERMQINGGLYLTYLFHEQQKFLAPSDVIFGTWYRLDDSFIFSMGLGNNHYTIGFSYDFNSSSLRYHTQGRGAYEISLTLMKIREKTIRRFHTPRI